MKKTVTTILSLALALILVSSLSSGVILAKGKKQQYKKVTVREVVIFTCNIEFGGIIPDTFPPKFSEFLGVGGSSGPVDQDLVPEMGTPCAEALAALFNGGFRLEASGIMGFGGFNYTLVKTFKIRVPVVNGHGDDDDDDDDDD